MTQVQLAPPAVRDPGRCLLEEVVDRLGAVSRLEMSFQCGTCSGLCPLAADMGHTPVGVAA
ncbi:MAG: hypothetical protein ACLQBX_19835 [Candidatus Limnocylindrales bacterium]